MTDAPQPEARQGLIGYWWAPVALIAVALAVVAYFTPTSHSTRQPAKISGPNKKPAEAGFLFIQPAGSTHVQTAVEREVCASGVAAFVGCNP